jgi:predicted metal-binding membrane protein
MWLAFNLFSASGQTGHPGSVTFCTPTGAVLKIAPPLYEVLGISKWQYVFSSVPGAISNGWLPWTIMVIAMMFPLLNEPVTHVAFSVKKKDRIQGVLTFLLGYILIWTSAGLLFLLLPLFVATILAGQTKLVSSLVMSSGFLLSAVLIWHPGRPVRLTKCSLTMPINIGGWQLYRDSFWYGLKIGSACLSMCWPPMAALALAHHNLILMAVVTIVIIYERYLLPHTSKLVGYAWLIIAGILFGIQMV